MADRFVFDPEGAARLAQRVKAARSDASHRPATSAGPSGTPEIDAAMQEFTRAATVVHTALSGSLERLELWLDAVAAGQLSLDERLGASLPADHTTRRSDT
ncbi:hypothetical protein [Micromonospora sp. NPDC004551]|uniref:hypothetical protein n=1 Tax=Micromonospora sp. NPDC004551 TaxID=3154284 RepID=UPI0033BE2B64